MQDNDISYGGISTPDILWRGKVYKIVTIGEIVNEFWTVPWFDYSATDFQDRTNNGFYGGESLWPIIQLIDNYFVFGTGQLFRYLYCMMINVFSGNTNRISIQFMWSEL